MNLDGIATSLLGGGLAFTTLVVVALVVIAFVSYFSVGMGMNSRRMGGVVSILLIIVGGVLAVMILFPGFFPSVGDWLNTLH